MTVIVNTTVISNFSVIGQLDVLRSLFGQVNIAVEVYDELMVGLAEGYEFYRDLRGHIAPFSEHGWICITSLRTDDEIRMFGGFPKSLHSGEAASMAIAYYRKWVFLTDDRAARKVSFRYGIPISGSVGCLVSCVERGLIDTPQANEWLALIIEQGFHSPVRDLRELLEVQAIRLGDTAEWCHEGQPGRLELLAPMFAAVRCDQAL